MQRLQVTRKLLETEEEAAFPLGNATPRYLYLASNHSNKWGHRRGYRIQILSFAGKPLPQESPIEKAFTWGRLVAGDQRAWGGEHRSRSRGGILGDKWGWGRGVTSPWGAKARKGELFPVWGCWCTVKWQGCDMGLQGGDSLVLLCEEL